jgi:tetratricopeptide (TPR) repeat protein
LSGFLIALTVAGRGSAAEPEWLKLQAPSFGVISQLDEDDTRDWAVEFEQFIDALHQLYRVENVALPPLTIVLFKRSGDFAPYRIQTESGQGEVDGFFGNNGSWSVIGLAGVGSSARTRGVIFHEAVHWFTSAGDGTAPLWFQEGFAEALSTFNVRNGKARWGEAIDIYVSYLNYAGLTPMDEFLRMSQDESLHGDGSDTYYPQAWLFVHYLLFGNGGVERSRLTKFLAELRKTDLDTAFETAFEKPYGDLTQDLRRYMQRGRYSYSEMELKDHANEMTIEPASPASVEFALARLAAAGGNYELAMSHADKVVELVPRSPVGHEMRAVAADGIEDEAVLTQAVDRAIELGSSDAVTYILKAEQVVRENEQANTAWDDFLPPDVARTVADLYGRSIGLMPRNRDAYGGLVTALLNVDSVTEADQALLSAGRAQFPTDGVILVGQAAAAKTLGNELEAIELLKQARAAPYALPMRYRPAVRALHADWLYRSVYEQFQSHIRAAEFDGAQALIAEQLADAEIPDGLRTRFERLQRDASGLEQVFEAGAAIESGDLARARGLLTALINDAATTPPIRRIAEDRLAGLPGGAR